MQPRNDATIGLPCRGELKRIAAVGTSESKKEARWGMTAHAILSLHVIESKSSQRKLSARMWYMYLGPVSRPAQWRHGGEMRETLPMHENRYLDSVRIAPP